MELKYKTKVSITAFVEISPKLFANVNGHCELEWEFYVAERNGYIDGVYIRVPDQELTMTSKGSEIDPESGMEIDLDGREFKIKISEIPNQSAKIKLQTLIEPDDVLVHKTGTSVSFTGVE